MVSVWPQSYETAAKECYALAKEYQTVYNPLQGVLLDVSAMAGGYQAVKSWSKSYDQRASALVLVATGLVRALQHFGDILTAAEYNWKAGEYNANEGANRGERPALPGGFPSELPYSPDKVVGIASSGSNSRGLESDIPDLRDSVAALIPGGEIPDGDTDKLARAATALKTFATSTPVEFGSYRLKQVAAGLQRNYGKESRDIPNLVAHLETMATSAHDLETAAKDIAAATAAHSEPLSTMRTDMNNRFAAVVVGASIVIAHSLVTIRKSRSVDQLEPDVMKIAASALATPINTFLTTLSGLTFSTAVLGVGDLPTIEGLVIVIVPIDGRGGDGYKTPAKGTAEYEKRIAELAKDPAHGGEVTPKSRREAEVGLELERRGDLKGPIERAQFVNGKDMGEFKDANGQYWDVKAPTDTFQQGPYAGQPMPPGTRGIYDRAQLEQKIENELYEGENVIVDTNNLSANGAADLRALIASRPEWAGKVVIC
ncbi:hypothetical protein [Nocardia camponoti]|uniref:Uncharacterized protein n=1 Tax=Nocardia camponoti TaxID=1616106 RepID=A0A917VE22_9NOCA|nr:hypothetical protein [Nocardia camponoti]GGK67625.1 hypothetical protein GCM10011591_44730 [Nocardia camponoti]